MNLVECGSLPERGRPMSDIIVLYSSRNADNLKTSVQESSTNVLKCGIIISIHFKNINNNKNGVIHGCTTFGSQVMTAAYSRRRPSRICPIWPPQLEPSLAPSRNWRVRLISTTVPKLVLVERFEQLW